MSEQTTVFEEDIELAFREAVNIFGPVGKMIHPLKDGLYNAVICTEAHGKLWYGDLERTDLSKLTQLENKLNTPVFTILCDS